MSKNTRSFLFCRESGQVGEETSGQQESGVSYLKNSKETLLFLLLQIMPMWNKEGTRDKKNEISTRDTRTLMRAESSFHCSGRGSTPVGLWAQAWSMITPCSGIFCRSRKDDKHSMHLRRVQCHSNTLIWRTRKFSYFQFWKHNIFVETDQFLYIFFNEFKKFKRTAFILNRFCNITQVFTGS